MTARRVSTYAVLLLCTLLFFGGCAAGSPSVVAPESQQPQQEDTLSAVDDPRAVGAVSTSTQIPAATATAAPIVESAQSIASPPAPAPNDDNPLALKDASTATGTVAFAQDGVLTPAPPNDPNATNPNAAAAETRPPPPPDPGTGLSTVIQGGSPDGRLEVALTFDAGADRGYGSEILDLLRDEGVQATFGMTGVYAEQNPDIVQRMLAEGHQLMNHTWNHPSLTGGNTGMPPLTADELSTQLWDAENLVTEITGGYAMRPYFRPPYGDYDAASLGYLYNDGFPLTVWWTCDSHGWAGWGAQEIVDYCTTNLVEDEIILMHVGAEAVSDFEALPGMIQSFRDKGYAFVTVEQMLQP